MACGSVPSQMAYTKRSSQSDDVSPKTRKVAARDVSWSVPWTLDTMWARGCGSQSLSQGGTWLGTEALGTAGSM